VEINLICSAGLKTGIGHLSRMIVVYNGLKKKFHCPIKFYIYGDIVNKINNEEIILNYIEFKDDLSEYINNNILKINFLQVFVFDIKESTLYPSFVEILNRIKINNGILIAIDSLIDFEKEIDFFFMPTFKIQAAFKKIKSDKITWGWQNFLLNSLYAPINHEKKSNNLLVLTGGSDSTNLGNHFPEYIDRNINGDKLKINWVVGPFSNQPNMKNVKINNWELLQSPKNLDSFMLNTKFAITVFGVSFFELLHYGVSIVVFSPYGEKDKSELKEIEAAKIAIVASDEKDAVLKMNELIHDKDLSRNLSNNARNILNGRGEDKLAIKILEIIKTKWQVHI
jgi:spore coat polysaccharide biosynthesis predicted glycosyltransferase SpsG